MTGLEIPFSLVLDRSIFFSYVDIRNFHTKGDLSLDNTAIYEDHQSIAKLGPKGRGVRLMRAEIGWVIMDLSPKS